jgi:phosphomannomutase
MQLGTQLITLKKSCLIAYDSRFMSDLFAQDLYSIYQQMGIPTSFVSMPAPLPAIHHAIEQQHADCALVVSGRNNSYWYNGLVLLNPASWYPLDMPAIDAAIQTVLAPFPTPRMTNTTAQGDMAPAPTVLEIRTPYLESIRSHVDTTIINRSTMTIFVDPMHGTMAGYLAAVLGEGGQTMAISINKEPDPLFDKLTPLPAHSNLTRLRKLVRESDSHLGLAFSCDGTALGVVDKSGEQLDRIEIALLIAKYLATQYRMKGLVITPPPNVEGAMQISRLDAWQKTLGLEVEVTNQAAARIADLLAKKDPHLLVGCTPEGEFVIGPKRFYPDALLAGLLVVEMVARSGRLLRYLLDDLLASLASA